MTARMAGQDDDQEEASRVRRYRDRQWSATGIGQLRRELGLTTGEFARKIGCRATSVVRLEAGDIIANDLVSARLDDLVQRERIFDDIEVW